MCNQHKKYLETSNLLNVVLKSKLKIFNIILAIAGMILLFAFMVASLHIKSADPFPLFCAAWAAGSFGFVILLRLIFFSKQIFVDEKYIRINYFFPAIEYSYTNEDLVGYKTYIVRTRTGSYKKFQLATSDNRSFILLETEFRNYNELADYIITKTKRVEMWEYFNWKKDLKALISGVLLANLSIIIVIVAG